jgi:hypothetical protein
VPPPPVTGPPITTSLAELPPERATSLWQIAATVYGAYYSIHEAAPNPDESGGRGIGTLEINRYLAPVIDDDAPRSLQPFLQRSSRVYVSLTGAGFVTQLPPPTSSFVPSGTRSDANIGVGAGVDIYVTPVVAITAGLGYANDALHDDYAMLDQHTNAFSAEAGFGIRIRDVRIDVRYAFQALDIDGTWAPLRWGTLTGNAYMVFDRRVSLNVLGRAIEQGGEGGVDLGVYATQDLGFFLGGYGERGHVFASDLLVNRYQAYGGLSYWFSARARLGFQYTFTLTDVPLVAMMNGPFGYDEYEHGFTLDAVFRLP